MNSFFCSLNIWSIFATRKRNGIAKSDNEKLQKSPHQTENGAIAQLVEQWTENPCVPGSIPGGTTKGSKLLPFVILVFQKPQISFQSLKPGSLYRRIRKKLIKHGFIHFIPFGFGQVH